MEAETYDQMLAKMTDAIDIERSRLRAIGERTAADALTELEGFPDSVVRLYEIIKGIYP